MRNDGEVSPWAEGIARLRAQLQQELKPHGIHVDEVLTLAAPVQVIGSFPGSERYYFRSRHDTASLEVWDRDLEFEGPVPPDPADLLWTDEIVEWSDFEASYLEEQDISQSILTFYTRFASRSTSS
jgi:hypothetical protein